MSDVSGDGLRRRESVEASSDEALIRARLQRGFHKEGHHPNCATRTVEGCDCYAQAAAPSLAALARLVALTDRLEGALAEIEARVEFHAEVYSHRETASSQLVALIGEVQTILDGAAE